MAKVTIYTTGSCPYCQFAKDLLNAKNISFDEVRVDIDANKREEMIRLSNRRTVPQIFINEVSIGGYDDLATIVKAGKLDELLNSK